MRLPKYHTLKHKLITLRVVSTGFVETDEGEGGRGRGQARKSEEEGGRARAGKEEGGRARARKSECGGKVEA